MSMYIACDSSPYRIVKPWSNSLSHKTTPLNERFQKRKKKDLNFGLTLPPTDLAQKIDQVDSEIKDIGYSYMIKKKIVINTNF